MKWNEISCTKLQLPPQPLTKGLPPPDSRSLCPLSSTEFVEPPRTKFLGTPLLATSPFISSSSSFLSSKIVCVCFCMWCLCFPHQLIFLQLIALFYHFRCFKWDFGSHFVSSPSHPVEQVAFHVSDLSTCIYFLTMLITVTFIPDSSTSRQLENLAVTVWRKWSLQFNDSIILSSFPS